MIATFEGWRGRCKRVGVLQCLHIKSHALGQHVKLDAKIMRLNFGKHEVAGGVLWLIEALVQARPRFSSAPVHARLLKVIEQGDVGIGICWDYTDAGRKMAYETEIFIVIADLTFLSECRNR